MVCKYLYIYIEAEYTTYKMCTPGYFNLWWLISTIVALSPRQRDKRNNATMAEISHHSNHQSEKYSKNSTFLKADPLW